MTSVKCIYVYEIPFKERKELCRFLDYGNNWKNLGGIHMGYSVFDIEEIDSNAQRSKTSPANMLLTKWGHQNHTIEELFVLLFKMKQVPALSCLKNLVDQKFHKLLLLCSDGAKNANRNCVTNTDTRPSIGQEINANTTSSNDVPLPVKCIGQGVNVIESSEKILNKLPGHSSNATEKSSSISMSTDNSLSDSASAIPMIPYDELVEATNNWHTSNILGKGGFGVVFRGDWKHTAVAIKRLKPAMGLVGESLRELRHLNACRHDNVLPLYGYSTGGEEPCLVYQLMTGGSLDQRLRCRDGRPPLTWKERLNITRGIAKGLQFLHTAPGLPLIHGDIKSANILLDTCGEPRIGDFGLARRGPHGHDRTHLKVSRVHGTRPYLPDELLRGHRLSPAVDTFSYGVVAFEIATALPAYDATRRDVFLKDHVITKLKEGDDAASLEDHRIKDSVESDPELCRKVILIGVRCLQHNPSDRPKMVQVWRDLNTY